MTPRYAAFAAGLLLAVAAPAAAQPPARPAAAADANDGLVAKVESLVAERYVYPERRAAIVKAVEAARRAGRYRLADPRELASRLTEDLRAAGHDRHLYVTYDPAGYRAATAPESPTDATAQDAADAERTRLRNHGVEELRILDGNVRYMRLTNFLWRPDETGRVYDDAMRFLRDGDAVIIDLRDNGGGDGSAVRYLVSHFLPGREEQLLITYRVRGEPEQSRVLGYLPAGRLVGKPLYVLISSATGSAAEEFAYHVEQFKLGELIGETTAGAGANNRLFPVAPAFVVSVSISAPAHAVSGKTWDGVGVSPTIAVKPAQALQTAHQRALQRLAASGPEPRRAAWRWAAESAAARLKPITLAPEQLAMFAGTYGAVSVRVADGQLVYQRTGRPEIPLVPLGGALFEMSTRPEIRIRFTVQDGRASDLHAVLRDGGETVMARTP